MSPVAVRMPTPTNPSPNMSSSEARNLASEAAGAVGWREEHSDQIERLRALSAEKVQGYLAHKKQLPP